MTWKRSLFLMQLGVIVAFIIVSCNSPKHSLRSNSPDNLSGESSRILFVDYQLSRDSATAFYDAQLLQMIIRKGTIKETLNDPVQPKINDLEILVMDKNQQVQSQKYIPNPLDRSVEYVNDAGQMERRMIHLDSVQFSVRLQIEPGASSIMLYRISGETKEGSLLLSAPIQ